MVIEKVEPFLIQKYFSGIEIGYYIVFVETILKSNIFS